MSRWPDGNTVSTRLSFVGMQRRMPTFVGISSIRGSLMVRLLCSCAFALLVLMAFGKSFAQESKISTNEKGFTQLDAPQLTLITDVPIDDELKNWPNLLQQSMQQWVTYFDVPANRMTRWRPTVYLISDRSRFQSAGYLDNIPVFSDGQQVGDQLFLVDQPSVYYRRHLFLHEATHWIMYKLYGGAGPPWFMEGMAEAQGTHYFVNNQLRLQYIPQHAEEVPYWGRLRLVSESIEKKTAPTLSEILSFDTGYQDRMLRYSWSWMAVVFFDNHPKYGPILRKLSRDKLDYSMRLSKEFKRALQPQWDEVLADWNAFVSDMDFGYDPARSMVSIDWEAIKPLGTEHVTTKVDASHGWQSTGIELKEGETVAIRCSGDFVLRVLPNQNKTVIRSEGNGITFDYFRGKPIGQLIGAIVPRDGSEETKPWEAITIGSEATMMVPRAGVLMLKINESAGQLFDNEGSLEVVIGPFKE